MSWLIINWPGFLLLGDQLSLIWRKALKSTGTMRHTHDRLAPFLISTLLCLQNARAFRIDPPLPPVVQALRPVVFTWFRETTDPSNFGFEKIQLQGGGDVESDVFPVRDANGMNSGSFTLTFTTPSPFLVVAVDRDHHSPRRTRFFVAPGSVMVQSDAVTTSPPQTRTETSSTSSIVPSGTRAATSGTSTQRTSQANSSRGTSTGSPPSPTSNSTPEENHKSKKAAIIGGVFGAVCGLIVVIAAIFFVLRRRKRSDRENRDTIPYTDESSSAGGASLADARECKAQIIGHFERQLRAYERAPRSLNGSGTESGTIDGESDVAQALRYQIEVLTERMARLEEGRSERSERQPPDYSSQ
ncbi:hypothetical protein L218DRAFT_943861 [Marasmius fiardii PR-910]|nr:hypothetical protein L218DRAFT_943861 [Marasmius fiardii PR-910]